MSPLLKTIVVDLTPMLAGGENGGAKVFVLELLDNLAKLTPDTHFILLTDSHAHDELKKMDRANMSRRMIHRPVGRTSFIARATGYALRKIPKIPSKLSLIGYRIQSHLRRRAVKSLLTEINADLVFCPFTAPTYAIDGIPTVSIIYDLQYKTYPSFFEIGDVTNREHTFTEACRLATKLVAISDYSKKSAITHGRLDDSKIQTVYLRMAKRIAPSSEKNSYILQILNLNPQQYLLYPANYWMHKNHEMLLTAFQIARHSGKLKPTIKLVCTGAPGERQKWLAGIVKDMGLESHVIFAGYLSNDDLSTLMSNSAGVVFPSLYEGFGMPILEAMATGVPVACSNTTSLPEIADKAALFFDPRIPTQIAEAMIELVSDETQRRKLIEAGFIRAELFSDPQHMATEYLSIFQNEITKKGSTVCN